MGKLKFKIPNKGARKKPLTTNISYMSVSKRKFYDGSKINYHRSDEEGMVVK